MQKTPLTSCCCRLYHDRTKKLTIYRKGASPLGNAPLTECLRFILKQERYCFSKVTLP